VETRSYLNTGTARYLSRCIPFGVAHLLVCKPCYLDEVRLDLATKLGIVVESNDLNVNIGVNPRAKATFNFDTLEDVQQGVSDLILTAVKMN